MNSGCGNKKYFVLCYHYIRTPQDEIMFPRILGTTEKEFHDHILKFKDYFDFISISQINNISGIEKFSKKIPLFFTFDDGLADHYFAAKILYEHGIRASFFIPTCIIEEKLPANPIIIHYFLAIFGIGKSLEIIRSIFYEFGYDTEGYDDLFERKFKDPWRKILDIKKLFKYRLSPQIGRLILLYIYKNFLLKQVPDLFNFMHLSVQQIKDIVRMGHSIGVHTDTHISVGSSQLSNEEFYKEIIGPKYILENITNTDIYMFSYPFGEKQDCLSAQSLIEKTKAYTIAFTVEEKVNTLETPLLEIGRFSPLSSQDGSYWVNRLLQHI